MVATSFTDNDCRLDGEPIQLDRLSCLTSEEIARVVGIQQPGGSLLDAKDFEWTYCAIPLEALRFCMEDGDEPESGWKAAYLRHEMADNEAVANGSPEYAGRQDWCAQWVQNSAVYPLFLSCEDDRYWLWDGHHRLASAFWHDVPTVQAFVGVPR